MAAELCAHSTSGHVVGTSPVQVPSLPLSCEETPPQPHGQLELVFMVPSLVISDGIKTLGGLSICPSPNSET